MSKAGLLGGVSGGGLALDERDELAVMQVETVGIEPTSAIAHEVASTSVAGALVSSRGRLAGGVPRNQPPEDVPGLAEADRPG
jgi:hypothetical protein